MALDHFTITRPSDMHCHFRQDEVLDAVVPATARHFAYAVAMPNTKPPITEITQAQEYIAKIRVAADACNPLGDFNPLGIAYLTDDLSPDTLRDGFRGENWDSKAWVAAKWYPANATTNSESGITSDEILFPKLEVMQEIGMPLLVHGELLEENGDPLARWLREKEFVDFILPDILHFFPRLTVVLEHVSTRAGIEFVLADKSGRLSASITPHHLLYTDADVSRGGLWVDANCLPIIKTASDRRALRAAAISGDQRFFAGTDSAPHDTKTKHCGCCSFGAFVAPGAIEAYAAVFDQEGVFEENDGIERFERFMSLNGPAAYHLPKTSSKSTIVRNHTNQGITERFLVPSKKILEAPREIVPLFHRDLGLAPCFPWIESTSQILE